jgi:cytochrome b subunit of formate dehydrogenase
MARGDDGQSERGAQARRGRGPRPEPWLALALLLLCVGGVRAADPETCLVCHQFRGLSRFDAERAEVRLLFVQPEYTRARLGPHGRLACTGCHARAAVSVIPHEPVVPVDCTQACHLVNPTGLERRFNHGNVAAMLQDSAHPWSKLSELKFARGALLDPGQSLCLYCHDEPVFRDPTRAIPVLRTLGARVFDRCEVCHADVVPVDIEYYVRHIASRLQPARPTLELAQVCAVCHSDAQVRATHDLPDAVASYVRSFHGKAALLGDQTTANCLSCHVGAGQNAHQMFGHRDPRSSVYPSRVASACRSETCHPGANPRFAAAAVHLDLPISRGTWEFALAAAFILLTIATFGPSAIIVLLELGHILIERHHHRRQEVEQLARAVLQHPEGRRRLVRFTPSQRVQHWVLVVLFSVLALTGFPMKFADRAWAATVIGWFGGLHVARTVHHWVGLGLIVGLLVHLTYVAWTAFGRRPGGQPGGRRRGLIATITALPMWMDWRDGLKALQLLAYLAFLRRDPPTFGRFSAKDKFEYIGVFWGTVVLGLTGLLLWGASFSSHFLSGRWTNLALIAHTYEAFLAIIHVGILHIVNVILSPNVFPLSPATLTGQTPLAELVEGHSELVVQVAGELGMVGPGAATEAGHA